jgi:hypothetical protein
MGEAILAFLFGVIIGPFLAPCCQPLRAEVIPLDF